MAFLIALPGCYENHTAPVQLPDGGLLLPDGAVVARDTGWTDVLGSYWNDAAPEGRRDAGVRPRPDAGPPPGDGLGDRWEGYVEAYTFSSGSDRIVIQLDSLVPGAPATGSVILGTGTPPAPATDPNVGWPVADPRGGWPPHATLPPDILEGYAYRFTDATVNGSRVQIVIDLGQPWAPWCELQYPVPTASGFGCLPDSMGRNDGDTCSTLDPTTNEWFVVDCVRAALCSTGSGACTCDATSCTSRAQPYFAIDFGVDGDNGTGTIADTSGGAPGGYGMHLVRTR